MSDSLRKPVIYNVELTNGTTEYSQVLPSNVRAFAMQPRTSVDEFWAHESGHDGSPVVTSVSDADVIRAQTAFDEFMALLSANGLLGRRVVVSECCVLSNTVSQADVMRATYPLVNHAMASGNVATVAWFSVYSAGAPAGSEFTSSDLVTGDQVNDLGRAWLEWGRP